MKLFKTQRINRFLLKEIGKPKFGMLFFHVLIFSFSYIFAFLLRFDGVIPTPYLLNIPKTIFLVIFIRFVFFSYYDMFNILWGYISYRDLVKTLKAVTYSSVVIVLAMVAIGVRPPSRSVVLLDWFVLIFMVGGIRMLARYMRERLGAPKTKNTGRKKVLIVGKLENTEFLIKDIEYNSSSPYVLAAIIEEDDLKKGYSFSGIPILGGLCDMDNILSKNQIDEVLIHLPDADKTVLNQIALTCDKHKKNYKFLPKVSDGFSPPKKLEVISERQELKVEALIDRKQIRFETEGIRRFIEDKVVFVTGAGGSIGSKLCEYIARFNPKLLILHERFENNLYNIELKLSEEFPDLRIKPLLGTINDFYGLKKFLTKVPTDIIFHVGAYKHVPLLEKNPVEGVYNNILGTRSVALAAEQTGVKKFVSISTDNAVSPSCVMGLTKRIVEMYIQALNTTSHTKFITVRFGNVLNSVGSVVPRFIKQITKGGPITITHPDMDRYFMTIPEAVYLILKSAIMG